MMLYKTKVFYDTINGNQINTQASGILNPRRTQYVDKGKPSLRVPKQRLFEYMGDSPLSGKSKIGPEKRRALRGERYKQRESLVILEHGRKCPDAEPTAGC